MDFAAADPGGFGIASGFTYVNSSATAGALPAGVTVPQDGTITGWRLETLGIGPQTFRLRVVRGNASVYLGPPTVFSVPGGAITTSPTIVDSIPVEKGDLIGLTDAGGPAMGVFYLSLPNNITKRWDSALGATQSDYPPDATTGGGSISIQADLTPSATPPGPTPTPTPTPAASCAGLPATHTGTEGPDLIRGTPGDDVIAALGGDDQVKAGGGNDLVCGGDGADQLYGGRGKDKLYGEAGRDTLVGGAGTDRLFGGLDKDQTSN